VFFGRTGTTSDQAEYIFENHYNPNTILPKNRPFSQFLAKLDKVKKARK
jgi:hypothetical protein